MKTLLVHSLATLMCVSVFGISACTTARAGEVTAPPVEARPVIVELFTSEGCSSCPPADAVLADLETRQPVRGRGAFVIPLAFHVDYWDDLGWKDPFSSPEWTRRQLGYRASGSKSLYTPQLVVDGHAEISGSDQRGSERLIEQAGQRPKATIALTLARPDGSASARATLTVRVGALPTGTGAADVMLAIVEPHARVTIQGGENRGRTLDHTSVVRSLALLGPARNEGTLIEKPLLEPLAGARAVVFVQERARRTIVAAAVTRESAQ